MARASKITTIEPQCHRAAGRPRRLPLEPLGLSREDAAAFIGLSPTKFDQLVSDGRMPNPRQADGRVLWSRLDLIDAFDALPQRAARVNPIDPWSLQCA